MGEDARETGGAGAGKPAATDSASDGTDGPRGSGGSDDGESPLAERIDRLLAALREWAAGLYHGLVTHPAYEKIEKEAEDVEDTFMLACFPDAFGVPSPVSYYTAELLPYLDEELDAWERRMWDRGSLLERKGQQYHF
ncbi:hypothetical protein K933_03205 [Candidatus Halobonum tyrrellensis G22]|uniref:Uncharacterized protein n=1 Tax=Candidatus Halobonum tyrrellensis G22 TaxID=1324957 RepID=V4GWJ3_9EURY|nr:hypothetical protein K933_03205 [Candidatus Halobonum tyrrellensis G22]